MRRSSAGKAVVWIIVILALALIAYLCTFAPGHYAQATGTVADGSEEFEVGGGATVTPAAGWSVESKVNYAAGPLTAWAVFFSDDNDTELRSPDRALTVDISSVPEDDPIAVAERRSDAEVITEVLASGAEVRHIQTGARLVAVVEGVGSEPVMLEAHTNGGADITEYRPAVSQLLESLR